MKRIRKLKVTIGTVDTVCLSFVERIALGAYCILGQTKPAIETIGTALILHDHDVSDVKLYCDAGTDYSDTDLWRPIDFSFHPIDGKR